MLPPRYSLWVVPPHPLREALRATIAEFARQLDVPPFEPHVTLLGDLACSVEEATEGAREIGRAARPFAVDFEGTGSAEPFFRAAYLRVRRSSGLTEARVTAERILGHRAAEGDPFEPHLSLAYGSLDQAAKERIFETARSRGHVTTSFVATRISLAESSTEVPIDRWRIVEEVELGHPSPG
ncbi:MAG: 2'-5' RNA ligase family protein [Gemmatimonadota bacterium]|nr:2'-5' RNA ligase family protein [Gemmatimonadota bacterium]